MFGSAGARVHQFSCSNFAPNVPLGFGVPFEISREPRSCDYDATTIIHLLLRSRASDQTSERAQLYKTYARSFFAQTACNPSAAVFLHASRGIRSRVTYRVHADVHSSSR